jgi:hypothetical protein
MRQAKYDFFQYNGTQNALILEYTTMPVANPDDITQWNTYFFTTLGWSLDVGGSQFISVKYSDTGAGTRVYLYGGNKVITNSFNYDTNLLKVLDYAGSIINDVSGHIFDTCTNLTHAVLPGLVKLENGTEYFKGCSALKLFDVPNLLDIDNIDTFAIFGYCTALQQANLPSLGSLSTLTLYEYNFSGLTSLKNVNLNSFLGPIGMNCFSGCTNLKEIYINSTTEIRDECFMDCILLEKIQFFATQTIGIRSFKNCTSLPGITSDIIITLGESAFENCNGLSKIMLQNATSIGPNCFKGCNSGRITQIDLTSVADPNLGGTSGDDGVFDLVNGAPITSAIFNITLQNNNGGNPDGDIDYLIGVGGLNPAFVTYI